MPQKSVFEAENEIIPHYESHWGTQNQMRQENYPQCATQWDSQNRMKRTNVGHYQDDFVCKMAGVVVQHKLVATAQKIWLNHLNALLSWEAILIFPL